MRKATLDERFKAFFFDWIIWGAITTGTFFIAAILVQDRILATKIVLPFAFWILFKDLNGNGFGKRRYNLEIRYKSNNKICKNPIILIIRNITILLWIIDLIMLFFESESRRLGEMFTDTYVVKK